MKHKSASLIFGLICAGSVSAEVIYFECSGKDLFDGGNLTTEFSIDMTKKVWETPSYSYSDINIAPGVVSASAKYKRNGFLNEDTLRLNRTDLSFSHFSVSTMEDSPHLPDRILFKGTCKIVETPKPRAF